MCKPAVGIVSGSRLGLSVESGEIVPAVRSVIRKYIEYHGWQKPESWKPDENSYGRRAVAGRGVARRRRILRFTAMPKQFTGASFAERKSVRVFRRAIAQADRARISRLAGAGREGVVSHETLA